MNEPYNKKRKLNSDIELAKSLGFENKFCVVKWDPSHCGLIYSIVNRVKVFGPFTIDFSLFFY